MTVAEEILAIFQRHGSSAYYGESVSMTEHALQAAYFARAAAAPPGLIIAALLHDIGHLIDDVPSDISDWTTDAHHPRAGRRNLARQALWPRSFWSPCACTSPAKRYLLGVDPKYFAKLSPASVVTLKLQGGAMAAHEVARFEAERYHKDAVRVRQWDDQGKEAGLKTPGLSDYRSLIGEFAA